MIYNETIINEIINRFNLLLNQYYKDIENKFKEYKDKENFQQYIKNLKSNHPYLKKLRTNSKIEFLRNLKAPIKELLDSVFFKDKFCQNEELVIYDYCIKKLRGLYKHAQALKTGYCNLAIINSFSESDTLCICITKNTLEANSQWLQRLMKELDERYPKVKLNDKIIIISSKKNTLNGDATHCKNIDDAWGKLKKDNNYKIVFVCSNKTRIHDIYQISKDYQNQISELRRNLRILHDEAHNPQEGIPAYREIIENIVCQPNVISYMPVTASNGSIFDEDLPLWKKINLELNALNYLKFDKTKSTDINYSSCNDSEKITFEELYKHKLYVNYNITQIPMEIVEKIHGKKEKDKKMNEKRQNLEFCQFMKNDKEIKSLNHGLNFLNINHFLKEDNIEIFQHNIFGIHIISTPRRNILTRYLAEEALKKDYNPLVLAIYGNEGDKYHLLGNDIVEKELSDVMGEGEFNNKLDNLFTHLKKEKINLNRPFIIMGNYTPTGESLSYVNYKYGTIRSNCRLISTNAEEDYQEACRSNFMNTKFIENEPNWKYPIKYLIGEQQYITNALSYEKENDSRIDSLEIRPIDINNINDIQITKNIKEKDKKGIVAIPIKIRVDRSDEEVKKLISIMDKRFRSEQDKTEFLRILKNCVNNDDIDVTFEDKSGKFDFDKYKLKDFRCYKKKKEGEVKKGQWKFSNYDLHFETETPFINNNGNHIAGQCEILTCQHNYILDVDGKKDYNSRSVWWMGYKY